MNSSMGNNSEDLLPPKPLAPHPSDCCGTGCCPCVHDIYEQDIKNWKKKCQMIQNGGILETQGLGAVHSDEWKEFEIIEVKSVGQNCFIYTFKLEEDQCLGLSVGQHIIVKQMKSGRSITRQYTPVSDIHKTGIFEVLIKIYDKGKMTSLIKDWKLGDLVPWRGPFGDFKYKANSYKCIFMLAAGTGIAPMYQIIKAIVDNDEDETFVKLNYASKSFADILLREELLQYCQYWNFTMCHFLSKEESLDKKKYNENVIMGRLAKDQVCRELMAGPLDSTLVLICGTKSFDKDMVNAVKNANVPDANIFKF